MKKILVFFFSIVTSTLAYSQKLDMGIRGGIASCWLLNENVMSGAPLQKMAPALSYNYGACAVHGISRHIAIELDIMYGTLAQSYKGTFSTAGVLTDGGIYQPDQTYSATTTLTQVEVPLLLHYKKGYFFWEFGVQYDEVINGTYKAVLSNPSSAQSYNVNDLFRPGNIQLALGAGDNIPLISNKIYMLADFRLLFGVLDFKGTDGLGQNLNNESLYTQSQFNSNHPFYAKYRSTRSACALLSLGIYYHFGASSDPNVSHHVSYKNCPSVSE